MFKVKKRYQNDTTGVVLVSLLFTLNMLKVNERNTRTRSDSCSSVSFINFEQVNVDWAFEKFTAQKRFFMKNFFSKYDQIGG